MSICGRAAPDTDAPLPLDRMLRALGSRGARQWGGGGVRLGAVDDAGFATAAGERAALFDGRLDNGAEVALALGDDAPARLAAPDLAIAAYAKWGEDFADRLIGDYACAVWDSGARRLVLATDPGESRTLFYWTDDAGEVRFASEAGGLWAEADVVRAFDEDRIVEWLALIPAKPGHTLFAGIRRVTGGTAAIWEDGRVRTTRWWRPENLPTLRLAKDDDYPQAVLAGLEQAVACRIAGDARIGSHLSGGLDSSAVTAIAARQLAAQGRPLTAFTAAPAHDFVSPPGRFGDEWGHAAAVASLYPNIEHVRISNDDMPLTEVIDLRTAAQDVPLLNLSNMVWGNAIDREARDRRVTVMLTGGMGNMSFSYDGGALARQQFQSGRIDKGIRTLLAARRVQKWRWKSLLGALGDAALPLSLARRLRDVFGTKATALEDFCAIHPDLLRSSGRQAELDNYAGDMRNLHGNDSRALRLSVLARASFRGEFHNASRRLYGVDTLDPTMDRRVFELCLTIPEDQYLKDGVPRSIARRMLRGILPDMLVDEVRKGLQAADWAHGFDAAVPGFKAEIARLRESNAAPRWLDLDRIERSLDAWPGAEAATHDTAFEYMTAVSRGLATGRFVRKIEGGNA
jgi:asparagine synthase (glutamine-hydrolysing)